MSAETLRRAAALMRERAEAALPSPWEVSLRDTTVSVRGPGEYRSLVYARDRIGTKPLTNAEHIASWHPAVALAVADWLDDAANFAEREGVPPKPGALAAARTYLGEQA